MARNLLKDIWSINIVNFIHRLAPAHFDANDFNKRKAFQGEFTGFLDEDTAAKTLEVLTFYDPRNAFKTSLDKIIVEFKTEQNLFDACTNKFYTNKGQLKAFH